MKILQKSGQSVAEYSLLVGVVIAVFTVLSPMVKQSTQGMVKIVADEIGTQQNAENRGDSGLISTLAKTTVDQEKKRLEWRTFNTHSVQMNYTDSVITETATQSGLGKREN